MATTPREWPNVAREARDEAAEHAVAGLRALTPLLDGDVSELERTRRVALAINHLQMVARLLEGVGAQTRP